MSYILDALRRADAERERGAVPGLHAQPVPSVSPDPPLSPGRSRAALVIGPVVVLALGALAWQWFSPAPAPAPASAPVVSAAVPAVAPPPPPAMPAVTAAAAPRAVPSLDPIPQPPPAAREAQHVPTLRELPEDLRRQVPTVTVGGSMYSDESARRMLILNGQIYHERDTVAPGLTLEQIRLKAAVLNYNGQRYMINF